MTMSDITTESSSHRQKDSSNSEIFVANLLRVNISVGQPTASNKFTAHLTVSSVWINILTQIFYINIIWIGSSESCVHNANVSSTLLHLSSG